MLNRYVYDSYGATQSALRTAQNAYQYTGQQFDIATGLYDLRARYYDGGVGRFISRDAFANNQTDPQQVNRYSYSSQDPISKTDPTGLDTLVGYASAQVQVNIRNIVKVVALSGVIQCASLFLISNVWALVKASAALLGLDDAFPTNSPNPEKLCHIPILKYPKLETPIIGIHIQVAQDVEEQPMLLHYEPLLADFPRYRACEKDNKFFTLYPAGFTANGFSCDEYPFAISTEGGGNSSIAPAPTAEQTRQGQIISSFTTVFRFRFDLLFLGNPFAVIPTNTFWLR